MLFATLSTMHFIRQDVFVSGFGGGVQRRIKFSYVLLAWSPLDLQFSDIYSANQIELLDSQSSQ